MNETETLASAKIQSQRSGKLTSNNYVLIIPPSPGKVQVLIALKTWKCNFKVDHFRIQIGIKYS